MSQTPRSVRLLEERLQIQAPVRCGVPHGWYKPVYRYRCRGRGWRYRPDRLRRELQILRYFSLEITAHQVARELGMSDPPIWHCFMAYRRWMPRLAEAEARPPTGELECDESYFGGRRRGDRRGWAVGQKVVVFGILERQGRVSTVVVPQADTASRASGATRRSGSRSTTG